MANGDGKNGPLSGWQTTWNGLAQAASWIMTTIGAFLIAPPLTIQGERRTWAGMGQFATAVLVGLMVVLRDRGPNQRLFVLLALVCLALAVGGVVWYSYLWNEWTCVYEGDVLVTGSEYTKAGQQYEGQPLTCDQVLAKFGGRAELVWTRESINRRQTGLALIYVGCVLLCTLCMASVVQVPFTRG